MSLVLFTGISPAAAQGTQATYPINAALEAYSGACGDLTSEKTAQAKLKATGWVEVPLTSSVKLAAYYRNATKWSGWSGTTFTAYRRVVDGQVLDVMLFNVMDRKGGDGIGVGLHCVMWGRAAAVVTANSVAAWSKIRPDNLRTYPDGSQDTVSEDRFALWWTEPDAFPTHTRTMFQYTPSGDFEISSGNSETGKIGRN